MNKALLTLSIAILGGSVLAQESSITPKSELRGSARGQKSCRWGAI